MFEPLFLVVFNSCQEPTLSNQCSDMATYRIRSLHLRLKTHNF